MHIKALVTSIAVLSVLSTAEYIGSSCDPVHNTTVCNSLTEIAVCNQNVWTLLTSCNSGTSCFGNFCIDENQPSSSDSSSTESTVSFSTTVMTPVACPFGKAYNKNDKYSDCIPYQEWWDSFVKEEESKSRDYFTFTASTLSSTTSGSAGKWTNVGGKVVAAAIALGVSSVYCIF